MLPVERADCSGTLKPCGRRCRWQGVVAKIAAVAAMATAGCGPADRATVTGTVLRHDGQPLRRATVTARSPETGQWASGVTDETGRFALATPDSDAGIAPGKYYVIILEDRGDADQRPRSIPRKYESSADSGLKLTLEPGQEAELAIKLDAA